MDPKASIWNGAACRTMPKLRWPRNRASSLVKEEIAALDKSCVHTRQQHRRRRRRWGRAILHSSEYGKSLSQPARDAADAILPCPAHARHRQANQASGITVVLDSAAASSDLWGRYVLDLPLLAMEDQKPTAETNLAGRLNARQTKAP